MKAFEQPCKSGLWPLTYKILVSRFLPTDEFKVECPTGSGRYMTLNEIANELSQRLARIFLEDGKGRRPVFNHSEKLRSDPHFKNCLLFYEYFHGDDGRGVGASHQTGWTGLVAKLIQPRRPPK